MNTLPPILFDERRGLECIPTSCSSRTKPPPEKPFNERDCLLHNRIAYAETARGYSHYRQGPYAHTLLAPLRSSAFNRIDVRPDLSPIGIAQAINLSLPGLTSYHYTVCSPIRLNLPNLLLGFGEGGQSWEMVIDIESVKLQLPKDESVQVIQVSSQEQFQEWVDIMEKGFGTEASLYSEIEPLWKAKPGKFFLLMALKEGKPASVCLMFLHNKVAGIYALTTLPEYRKRKLATQLIEEGLKRLKEVGCTKIAMATSNPDLRKVYEQHGAKCVYSYYRYVHPMPKSA